MNRISKRAAALGVLLGASPAGAAETIMNNPDLEEIAVEILVEGLARGDARTIERHVAKDYIQHNPSAQDGRAGLLAYAAHLQRQSVPLVIEPIRVLRDGDLVAVHSVYVAADERSAVVDLFRFEGSKAVEHWDAIQAWPKTTVSGRTMTDGPTFVLGRDRTSDHRKLVQRFYAEVLIGGRPERADSYLGERYAQHNPRIADGKAGFVAYFEHLAKEKVPFELVRTHRSVAEGNYVLLHSEGRIANTPHAFFDLFRVEDGRIVEHWDVVQAVPETAAHGNGMF